MLEFVSKSGHLKLVERLNSLKDLMDKCSQDLAKAGSYGDLRENADYSYAEKKLSFYRNEYQNIINYLKEVHIVREKPDKDLIGYGHAVDLESSKGVSWKITLVGKFEIDLKENMIYFKSPMGLKLLGLRVGDKISIKEESWTVKGFNYIF